MTKEERLEAYKMHLDGASYAKIGEKFGVSRQYIYQMFPMPEKENKGHSYMNMKIKYPALREWTAENKYSMAKLSERIDLSITAVANCLYGKCYPSRYTIDAILRVTGLTYEEAFREET